MQLDPLFDELMIVDDYGLAKIEDSVFHDNHVVDCTNGGSGNGVVGSVVISSGLVGGGALWSWFSNSAAQVGMISESYSSAYFFHF